MNNGYALCVVYSLRNHRVCVDVDRLWASAVVSVQIRIEPNQCFIVFVNFCHRNFGSIELYSIFSFRFCCHSPISRPDNKSCVAVFRHSYQLSVNKRLTAAAAAAVTVAVVVAVAATVMTIKSKYACE